MERILDPVRGRLVARSQLARKARQARGRGARRGEAFGGLPDRRAQRSLQWTIGSPATGARKYGMRVPRRLPM